MLKRRRKTLNLSRSIVGSMLRLSTLRTNLSHNICCGLKKVVAKRRAQVYFEQQILALLLVFHQTQNLSRNKFVHATLRDKTDKYFFANIYASLNINKMAKYLLMKKKQSKYRAKE